MSMAGQHNNEQTEWTNWTGKVCTQDRHIFSSVSPELSSVSRIYMSTAYVTYSFKVPKFNLLCCSIFVLNYLSVCSPSHWISTQALLKSNFPKSVKTLCFTHWGYTAAADGAEHVRNMDRFITYHFEGKAGTAHSLCFIIASLRPHRQSVPPISGGTILSFFS